MQDFKGKRINFVQIGLGTNSTFIQNCGGQWHEWDKNIDWLLWACSEHQQDKVRGIAVEPVAELVDALRGPADGIPLVALVQVAMGECEVRCADMQVFSVTERDRFVQQVPDEKQAEVKRSLEYLVNMSSVGVAHPLLQTHLQWIVAQYDIHVAVEKRQSEVWTWWTLAEKCNFIGCEVLVIDTEGSDAAILRSMIEYCQRTPSAWPDLIQFETMGHCDEKEGWGTEWGVIEMLQKKGYMLVNTGRHNSHLVLGSALDTEQRLQD